MPLMSPTLLAPRKEVAGGAGKVLFGASGADCEEGGEVVQKRRGLNRKGER